MVVVATPEAHRDTRRDFWGEGNVDCVRVFRFSSAATRDTWIATTTHHDYGQKGSRCLGSEDDFFVKKPRCWKKRW